MFKLYTFRSMLLFLLLFGITIFQNLWAEPPKDQSIKTPFRQPYAGKAYNCDGQWQPFPCAKPTIVPKPTSAPLPPEDEEEVLRKQQFEKQILIKQKESLITDTRKYAQELRKKYDIVPRRLGDVETFCRAANTSLEACRQQLFEVKLELARYEKELRKRQGIPPSGPDKAKEIIKQAPPQHDYQF